ncbi:unnamed protein product [Symbiodinium sp. CCMP2456]|nr:unnamed protein product [Symbiodinium sp. CCMP2456]
MQLYQTPPASVSRRLQAKVASTLRMQIWDGKTWQKLADIPKPPLWEIDNFGRPFVFKPPLEAMGLVTTTRPPEQQQEAEEDFLNRFGISLPALVSICLGVGPILASPRTLNIFRMNAPERSGTAVGLCMDAKKMKQLDSILKMKREVKSLESQVQEHATATDDWGMSHKVQSEEQRMLERQLDRKRKQQAKMERTAESGEQKEVKKEEQVQRKRADDERYRRMKEAYRPKTIAVDGVALRAPESVSRLQGIDVLLELGFEPEALEAFSMPGMDADGNLVAAPEDEDEEEAVENEDEAGPPPPPDDEASEEAFDLAALQEAARNAKFDDAALRTPANLCSVTARPPLDEAPNIAREGAGLKRRGAMAGPKEGQPMDAELLKRAQRKAAGLKVDKWIGPGSEPSSSRPDTSRSQASNAQLLDWDALDVDKEALKKEKLPVCKCSDLGEAAAPSHHRRRALYKALKRRPPPSASSQSQPGGKKDAAAAAESDDSQDEDIEVKLGRAAAPVAEGALMSVFIKKEPTKATQAREVQEPAEPEELALPVVPEASSAAGSQQAYQGKAAPGQGMAEASCAPSFRCTPACQSALAGLAPHDETCLLGRFIGAPWMMTLTKDGLPWGRFHSTKPHYRTPEEKAEAVKSQKQMGFFQRMFGGGGDEADDLEVVEEPGAGAPSKPTSPCGARSGLDRQAAKPEDSKMLPDPLEFAGVATMVAMLACRAERWELGAEARQFPGVVMPDKHCATLLDFQSRPRSIIAEGVRSDGQSSQSDSLSEAVFSPVQRFSLTLSTARLL